MKSKTMKYKPMKYKPIRAYTWIGSKARLIPYLPTPPKATKRIVELYGGSASYSLAYSHIPSLAYELDGRLCEIMNWLKTKPVKRLHEVKNILEGYLGNKEITTYIDIKNIHELNEVEKNLCILSRGGLFHGQFGCTRIYIAFETRGDSNRHFGGILNTIDALNHIDNITMVNKSNEEYVPIEGDLIFIDPPYLNTTMIYNTKYNPQTTIDFIHKYKHSHNIILTYGTTALEFFPDYDWKIAKEINTGNHKGNKKRIEYYCTFGTFDNYSNNIFE